jgi:RHS repeat-associated protein
VKERVNGQVVDVNKNYASSIGYGPHGAMTAMTLGNGRVEHTSFNSRLQPVLIGLGTSVTDSSLFRLDYTYGTSNNNGDVMSQKISVPGISQPLVQTYTYDSLNRLEEARENLGTDTGALQWKQRFTYDRFGNRNFHSDTTVNVMGPNPVINQANNRIVANQGYLYDGVGNLTQSPTGGTPHVMAYDGANRQKSFTNGASGGTTTYEYDGDGRRVKRVDAAGTTVFVYNVQGQLIAEYRTDPVSPPAGGGGTSYLTTDHLGSTRVVTAQNGTVKARYDYLPFGEALGAGLGGRTTGVGYDAQIGLRQKFTSKERDAESGLDYFLARYYSSPLGRFASVDPYSPNMDRQTGTNRRAAEARFAAFLTSPQQWNRYIYAIDDPLKYVDPTGERIEIFGNEEERRRAFERIKAVVGPEGAKLLFVKEVEGRFFVETKSVSGLADTGELGLRIAILIATDKITEFHIATTFRVKVSEWWGLYKTVRTRSVASFGGGATLGAEESLTGNAQIFVHPNAGDIATDVLGYTFLGGTRSSDGKPLVFYNDIVDAHEFGHAYANVILRIPLAGSDAAKSFPWALRLENEVRKRRNLPNRRVRE